MTPLNTHLRALARRSFISIIAVLLLHTAALAAAADLTATTSVSLAGHVLPALERASAAMSAKAGAPGDATGASSPLDLTIVMQRTDSAGFQGYLTDVYDQASLNYRKFLAPLEISTRFGPSAADYSAVAAYFRQQGFTVDATATNRMTMTVSGTRADIKRALSVDIADYRLGSTAFFANDRDPQLPADIASRVEAVIGMNSLASPQPNREALLRPFCELYAHAYAYDRITDASGTVIYPFSQTLFNSYLAKCMSEHGVSSYAATAKKDPPPPAWQGADGTGQTIGVVAFDSYLASDVSDYIAARGLDPSTLGRVTLVNVGGGAAAGADQSEVLLDIAAVLNGAPGARVTVYSAPFTGGGASFQNVFNAMINGGVNIISNSWAYCEDQTTLADVQSIDSILQTAAASGIGAFSGSGDHGSTCLDGRANTVHVPASSPHITAVGGTTLKFGPGFTYASETWWDGSSSVPPTGQGGFGVSSFFPRPTYQNGLTASATRSVPDVASDADPINGILICQASAGGCPSGLFYGGTSRSAPSWAAYAALLNQTQGSNLGFLNPLIYPHAGTNAFHSATSMGIDFAHVGLGSPNLARLHQKLTAQTVGPIDGAVSEALAFSEHNEIWVPNGVGLRLPVFADGITPIYVVVRLADANGNIVEGATATLTASPGSHAVITPSSGVSNADNGAVIFKVTNLFFEPVTFTATATPGNVVIHDTPTVDFVPPHAASAGIAATPSSVPPDQTSTTIITVTLKDALNRPSPGKHITLSQAGGHSVISGPTPAITDANGQIQFTATNGVSETVVYTAVDVTDLNLPVPGSATVNFSGTATSCVAAPPVAAPGFAVTAFSTGYFAQNFFFGNVNWGGCPGASNPTFSPDNNVYVANFRTGDLFRLGLGGGAVSNGNKLSNLNQTLGQPTFGRDGRLYATHGATTGNFTTGNIVEVDPATGAQIRVLASNLTCPNALSVDPLSGDLFFDDQCFGAGSNDPSLYRIHDPAGAATLSVYATLPTSPNGAITFSPDGTMYVNVGYLDAAPQVVKVSGTNIPGSPVVAVVPNLTSFFWVTMGQAQPNGAAKSLLVLSPSGVELVDITTSPYTRTLLVTGQGIGSGVIGPDGCIYAAESDTIYKVTTSAGTCGFVPTSPGPALVLAPASVTPNPAQGTTQVLTASFKNIGVPAGTPVAFTVNGANPQVRHGTTDANGIATVSYVGVLPGIDTVTALGTAGSTSLTSNATRITWVAARHVTSVGLNLSPSSGAAGVAADLIASLTDVSSLPNAPIVGATISFSLGGQTCNAITNGNGIASCSVIPPAGQLTLTASFAGNGGFTASSDSERFSTFSAAGATAPGAPVIGSATPGNGSIVLTFAPPASDGGSPVTSYAATCTPVASGAAVSTNGGASPITIPGLSNGVAYRCTVSAANAVGSGPVSALSNAATPAGAVPPVAIVPVPVLSGWGQAILATLLALVALAGMRRRR